MKRTVRPVLTAALGAAIAFAAAPALAQTTTLVVSNGKCLDVHGPDFESRLNGARLQSWDCHGGGNQQWSWRGSALVAPNGKCLDIHGPDFESRVNGGRLQLWDCHGGPNQQWHLSGRSIVAANGKCLDLHGADFESRINGGRVQMWDCNGGQNQQWSANAIAAPPPPPPPPAALYTTLVVSSGKCLDVHGPDFDSRLNGARLQSWDCHGGPNQQWSWRGSALVAANGKCLDIHGPDFESRVDGGRLQLWDCHGGPNQQWHVHDGAIVAANGKCLDLHGADFESRVNGGRIQMWSCNRGRNQRWSPNAIASTSPPPAVAFERLPGWAIEPGVNRPGADYRDFDLAEARPGLCRIACAADLRCAAFVYAMPHAGFQRPHCWLKSAVPTPAAEAACTSGVRSAGASSRIDRLAMTSTFEPAVDHPNADYNEFDMSEARPEVCQAACQVEPACAAWAYAVPSRREPRPHCWLKSAATAGVPNRQRISGLKGATALVVSPPPPATVELAPPPPAPPPTIYVMPPPPGTAPMIQVIAPPPPGRGPPMADFGRLVEAVKREAFSAGKLNVLNEAARVNWFSVDQVKALLRSFSFGADKVTALRQLAPRIIDPQNNFQIYGAFTFSAEKEEAKEILRPYN